MGKPFEFAGLREFDVQYMDYVYPLVSLIIPTFNDSKAITVTLEKALGQAYPNFEIIIVDAGSTDRTLDVINSFFDTRVRICTVADNERYEMLNKGISLSKGSYLQFMLPGEFYLSEMVIRKAMQTALENGNPDLCYGASLRRHALAEPEVCIADLSEENLKRGIQPALLRSCFFQREIFRELGKFKNSYELRGDFEFFCRIAKDPAIKVNKSSRVYTDADYRQERKQELFLRFKETVQIIAKHFGWAAAFSFVFRKGELKRLCGFWYENLKGSFTEK